MMLPADGESFPDCCQVFVFHVKRKKTLTLPLDAP